MSLPEALERAAEALPNCAEAIRPANGDPSQLLSTLDGDGGGLVLAWLLGNEPADAEELLLAWCDDELGVERVLSVDVNSLPKVGKKLLRKALHRIRTRGVEVDTPGAAEPVVARLAEVADEIAGAYMTPVDPRGSVLLFVVEGNPSGGARLFQVLLDERRGVVEFDVYNTGRSKTRSFLRKLTAVAAGGSPGAVQIDGAIARGLIRRIASIHPGDRPYPRPFSEWRRKLEAGAGDETPGTATRRALGDPSQEIAEETDLRVAQRVGASEIGPWPGEPNRLTEVSAQLGAAIDGVVAMTGAERSEALEAAVGEATVALFEGEHAAHTAARFETSAYVAWKTAREGEAVDLLAAAAALRAGNLASSRIARAMTEVFAASILKRAEEPPPETDEDATPLTESAPVES